MKREEANAIAMFEILKKLGYEPVKDSGNETFYISPINDNKAASFVVDKLNNAWYDLTEGSSGDVVEFVRCYLKYSGEDNTDADIYRWLMNMSAPQTPSAPDMFSSINENAAMPALCFERISELRYPALVKYLESKGISIAVAKKYLNEILVRNLHTGKKFYAFGLATESEGFELRNRAFRGSIGTQSISFIRGTKVPADEIHIFEDMMDFLSAVMHNGEDFQGDVLILNSVFCLPMSTAYIRNYSYRKINTWLNNDTAGVMATRNLKDTAEILKIGFTPMNKIYAPFKSVNAWHLQKDLL